jgi:Na+/H+-dicarboxylate symporter
MQASNKMSLTTKVLIAMFAGIIIGLIINIANLNGEGSFINSYIVDGLLLTIGKMFVNALKMLVVPLVFFSLICGVCGIGNLSTLGRVGTKSFILYLLTTAIAIAVAISLAATAGIGEGMNLQSTSDFAGKEAPPLTQVFINIIPSNPIQAMANGDMLPIIFFAILTGISILMVGKKSQ